MRIPRAHHAPLFTPAVPTSLLIRILRITRSTRTALLQAVSTQHTSCAHALYALLESSMRRRLGAYVPYVPCAVCRLHMAHSAVYMAHGTWHTAHGTALAKASSPPLRITQELCRLTRSRTALRRTCSCSCSCSCSVPRPNDSIRTVAVTNDDRVRISYVKRARDADAQHTRHAPHPHTQTARTHTPRTHARQSHATLVSRRRRYPPHPHPRTCIHLQAPYGAVHTHTARASRPTIHARCTHLSSNTHPTQHTHPTHPTHPTHHTTHTTQTMPTQPTH